MSAEAELSSRTRERELFLSALEKSSAERAAFLEAACARDLVLRQRVEALLREQADVGSFLETPVLSGARAFSGAVPVGPDGTAFIGNVIEKAGDRIGRYKLLQKIGEGGCGVV